MGLAEEAGEVVHVLGALDGDGGVELIWLEGIIEPIAEDDGDAFGGVGFGVVELGGGDGDAGDLGVVLGFEHSRGGAVAAADVADDFPGGDVGALGYAPDELEGGLTV